MSNQLSARDWNARVARPIEGARLRPGTGVRTVASLLGQTLSRRDGGRWRHPWFTFPYWDGKRGEWVATVRPGFVNGVAPLYRMRVATAPAQWPDFGINPLTGEPYFSADVFDKPAEGVAASEPVDVPLTIGPAIGLRFRSIGWDGDGDVPAFFSRLGVAAPKPDLTESLLSGEPQNIADTVPPAGLRLLRACDIYVSQPRNALTSQVMLAPLTGQSNVTQTLSFRGPAPEDRLRIAATPKLSTLAGASIDPVSRDFEEATFDQVLVSTVFLLSPRNARPGSAPDRTWRPYVRHNLFWNLCWSQPELQVLPSDPGVPFIPPLAGGAAQIIINFLVGEINDATQRALNILQAHSLAGTFWTITGSGHSAAEPDLPTPAEGSYGLDKAARLEARRREIAQRRRSERLDPPFPYRAEPFSPALLS